MDQGRVLLTLVRAAVATRAAHAPMTEYTRQIARLAQEGVDVGHKHHTHHFLVDVQRLAALCLQHYDAADLHQVLPGLGISGDFAVLLDGVPVGGVSLFGRHGSIVVVCTSSVGGRTGRLHARLLTWFVPREGHGGPAMAKALLDALAAHPAALTLQRLRARLSLVGGDGQVVSGGPDRPNPGTQAGEILWGLVHPGSGGAPPLPTGRPRLATRGPSLPARSGTHSTAET